jgi:hypothetical protein
MVGSLAPVTYWGHLCGAFRSDDKQLPYQAVMQPVRMLSMVQLYNFLRIWGPKSAKSFQSPEEEKVLSCPLHNCLGVLGTKRKRCIWSPTQEACTPPPLPNILHANIQSLDNKVDELRARISFQRDIRDSNILCFMES